MIEASLDRPISAQSTGESSSLIVLNSGKINW